MDCGCQDHGAMNHTIRFEWHIGIPCPPHCLPTQSACEMMAWEYQVCNKKKTHLRPFSGSVGRLSLIEFIKWWYVRKLYKWFDSSEHCHGNSEGGWRWQGSLSQAPSLMCWLPVGCTTCNQGLLYAWTGKNIKWGNVLDHDNVAFRLFHAKSYSLQRTKLDFHFGQNPTVKIQIGFHKIIKKRFHQSTLSSCDN